MSITKVSDNMRDTTTLDATKLSGDLPSISGASLTNLPAPTYVQFPSTAVPDTDPNRLDEYEEGTFNVTVASNTGTLTIGGGSDTLAYIKIGRMVHINGEISFATASSPAGTFFIYGLPFACESLAEGAETCVINSLTTNANSAFEGLKFYTVAGSTTLFGRHEGRTNDGSNCANYVDTGSAVRLTGTYYATD